MVSTRRTKIPSSPPNLSLARAVPDDPPPPPPTNRATEAQSPPNPSCTKSASTLVTTNDEPEPDCRDFGAAVLKREGESNEKVFQKAVDTSAMAAEEEVIPLVAKNDDADSDAPDVEPSSAAMSLARAQMEQERIARAAVQREQRVRRRARAVASEARRTDLESNNGGSIHQSPPSMLLPDDVLRAVEDAVGEQRKSELVRRKEEKLKKQKRKLERREDLKSLTGFRVAVTVSKRNKGELTAGRRGRESAAAFLKASMDNHGLRRVSPAAAARIATKAKLSGL